MKVGFIGIGNMNGSIVDGLLASGFEPQAINVYNRTRSKLEKYINSGINIFSNMQTLVDNSDIVILGFKPNMYEQWLLTHDISKVKFISIGAGISSELISKYSSDFVLAMPNTPAQVLKATTLIVENESVDERVIEIFEAIGSTHLIKEEEIDMYTLITGSSPAYFFKLIEMLVDEFTSQYDLDPQLVSKLLIDVMDGSASMLKNNNNATELTNNVCSPGGITIEVVNGLGQIEPLLAKALADGAKRAKELRGK